MGVGLGFLLPYLILFPLPQHPKSFLSQIPTSTNLIFSLLISLIPNLICSIRLYKPHFIFHLLTHQIFTNSLSTYFVLVSHWYHNKFLQAWCKMIQINYFIFLGFRSPKWVLLGEWEERRKKPTQVSVVLCSFWRIQRKICSLALPSCLHFLISDPVPHLHSQWYSIF